MPENYKLINPCIIGTYESTFSASKPEKAAEDVWLSISQHITNNVPQFAFSLENQRTKDIHHYVVKESTGGGKIADYSLEELKIDVNPNQLSKFRSAYKKMAKTQKGGKSRRKSRKHEDDSSSSSSDDDDIFEKVKLFKKKNMAQPIAYWWYYPYIYSGLSSLYIPTFSVPLTPYVEIELTSAFLG